jgi:hypothetical protein
MTTHDTGTPQTEAHLMENVFQDGQGNNSITAQDMRNFVASTRYLQPLGWEFRFDSQYHVGNKHSLDSGAPAVPVKITFTANPGEDLRYPTTFPEIWHPTYQKLDITGFANGFGIIRLSTLATYTGGTLPHLELQIDVGSNPVLGGTLPEDPGTPSDGSASNIIYSDTQNFAKDAGGTQAFNWIIPLFGGSDFVTNGAQIIIAAHNADVQVWDHTITAAAILVPNPAGEG